jgi:glyoxylase-like metal-dependent hydrolase (beta-lactamase superfamily II)
MLEVREVGKNIYSIDDQLYSVPGAGCVYFLAEEKKALIDTGPASSTGVILEGIQQIGFKSTDVDYILITHIHLDHAGGAGTLLKNMPQAKVVVHYKGIKHLIDPSRLILSAKAAQGKDSIDRNGEVLPIAEQRLIPARDGDKIKLSHEQILTLLDAPGHAPHELCVYESRNGGIFVGDAVGHYIEGTDVMIPVTPPPSFDLDLYLETLDRLLELKASRIYFAHAGTSNRVKEKLEAAKSKLEARDDLIAKAAAENKLDTAAEIVVSHICDELRSVRQRIKPLYDSWANNDIPMSAAEHVRYYRKKHGL